jgi:uncharacterized protein YkwD
MYAYSSITRKESKITQPTLTVDFEDLRNSIYFEHNKLREDPSSYIPILEKQKAFFKENILSRPRQTPIITQEGPRAFDLAIEFLRHQKPVPILTHDNRLTQAALEQVKDHGPLGTVSHESTNGKTIAERIEKFCEWDTCCAENIDVGSITAIDAIVTLLVDDGLSSRVHRENLFNPLFKHIGLACGPHNVFGIITVLTYTGRVRQLNSTYYESGRVKYEYPDHVYRQSKKDSRVKNIYQQTDPDAPNDTVGVKLEERFRIVKDKRTHEDKKLSVIKKQYTLGDGSYHVVEVEEY